LPGAYRRGRCRADCRIHYKTPWLCWKWPETLLDTRRPARCETAQTAPARRQRTPSPAPCGIAHSGTWRSRQVLPSTRNGPCRTDNCPCACLPLLAQCKYHDSFIIQATCTQRAVHWRPDRPLIESASISPLVALLLCSLGRSSPSSHSSACAPSPPDAVSRRSTRG